MEIESTNIEKYISFIVKKELKKEDISFIIDIIKEYGPSDIISSISKTDNNNMPQNVNMIKKQYKSFYNYVVPLKRDLLSDEAKVIAELWNNYYPYKYKIMFSQQEIQTNDEYLDNYVAVTDDEYNKFAYELSKYLHNRMVKKRLAKGWKYGITNSYKNKTSPKLLPFEQIPDENKKIDDKLPEIFLKILEDIGYTVILKDELKLLNDKLKKNNN